MNLGICLSGIEEQFERALRERAKAGERFVYAEVGTAGCETFKSVHAVLNETGAHFFMIAIDPAESARKAYVSSMSDKLHTCFLWGTREDVFTSAPEAVGDRLDFVFLDGCHSQSCVIGDFLAVEPLVVPGGLVVFHDIEDVVGDIQMHCNAERGVRKGLERLSLWQNLRHGWNRLPDWQCDKTKNAFSCAVFQRI